MTAEANSSHLLDVTVRRRWPRPLAQAWGRVLVATDPFERQERLLTFTWLLFRVLASYAFADYVQDPPRPSSKKGSDPENLLAKLTRPTDGDWQSMVFHPMKAIVKSRAAFVPELWAWLVEEDANGETHERALNRMVQFRNVIRHGAAAPSANGATIKVEQYERDLREILNSMQWMAGYRLVRVATSETLSTPGAFKGSFQFFAGSDDAPERVDTRWRGWFQRGTLYLVSPDATRALDLSPFISVMATAQNPVERVFVIDKVTKQGLARATDDRTAEHVEFRPKIDDRELEFDAWLARRPLKRMVAELADVEGKLAVNAMSNRLGNLLVDGKYRIKEQLGRGAMGTVYRARHEILGRDYALKVLHEGLSDDPVLSERFRREARLMTEVDSTYVLAARDVGALPDGRFYIATDLVEGGSLADLVVPEGRAIEDVARHVADAARGLHALHALGAVHRDVKPENLLVRSDGTVIVADMGMARADDDVRLTATLERVGSRAYMAPEVLQGGPATPASDIYSLGVVAVELLNGSRPLITHEVLGSDPVRSSFRRMLALEPSVRPTAEELVRQLERVIQLGTGTTVGGVPPLVSASAPRSDRAAKPVTPHAVAKSLGDSDWQFDEHQLSRSTTGVVPDEIGAQSLSVDEVERRGPGKGRPRRALMAAALFLIGIAALSIVAHRLLRDSDRLAPGTVASASGDSPALRPCFIDAQCGLGERCAERTCAVDRSLVVSEATAHYQSMARAFSRGDAAQEYFEHYSDPIRYWYNRSKTREDALGTRRDSANNADRDYDVRALVPVEVAGTRASFIDEGRITYENGACIAHTKLVVVEPLEGRWRITGEMSLARWDAYPGESSAVPRFYASACGSVTDSRTGLEWFVDSPLVLTFAEATRRITALDVCCAGARGLRDVQNWRLPTVGEVSSLFPDTIVDGASHPLLDELGDAFVWTSDGDDEVVTISVAAGAFSGVDPMRPQGQLRLLAVRGG